MASKKSTAAVASKSDAIREAIAAQPKATLKDIKARLEARGIKASDALINKIKYARNGTGGKKGKGAKRRKRGAGVSKADAIRNMFREMGRRARPRDIIAALKARGVVVTSAQVSTLRRKRGANGALGTKTAGAVSLDHLLVAKHLADRLGGIDNARQVLDNLARLIEA